MGSGLFFCLGKKERPDPADVTFFPLMIKLRSFLEKRKNDSTA